MAAELAVAPSARAGEGRTSAIRARECGLEPQASAPRAWRLKRYSLF